MQDITAQISKMKAPIQQLVGAAGRADKALKSAIEQLKKQASKKQAQASKGKKSESHTTALYDQGVSLASQIVRVALGGKVDASTPFIMDCSALVSSFMAEGKASQQAVASFKVSFDEGRKTTKGLRVSKALDTSVSDKSVQELQEGISKIFEPTKALVDRAVLEKAEKLKAYMQPSLFGIDASYDRVSAEALGLATGRLCLEGTRCIVTTDMLQLHGFMERKGIVGHISVSKMSGFFKAMHPSMLSEYQKECTLWTSTLSTGDFLYTPYGFVQGELVSQASLGVRWPLVCTMNAHVSAVIGAKKRKEELDRVLSGACAPDQATKLKAEAEAMEALIPLIGKLVFQTVQNTEAQP